MPTKSKKPPATLKRWRVYHLGQRGELFGTVMAANAEEALEQAIKEFNIKERDRLRTVVREAD
jgi:1,2-phenylacetyl-CoA epoxidase PaaB subunit